MDSMPISCSIVSRLESKLTEVRGADRRVRATSLDSRQGNLSVVLQHIREPQSALALMDLWYLYVLYVYNYVLIVSNIFINLSL